jgi:hypothetical protein
MRQLIVGLIGFILGLAISIYGQTPEFQRSAPQAAPMPGGVGPDGKVQLLKLDKDGYVLATCRNKVSAE